MDTTKKPQALCLEIYVYLVCKTRNFLLSACQRSAEFECSQFQANGNKLESSRASNKHMKHQPASQPHAKGNQLRQQRVNLPQNKTKGTRKQPYQIGKSQAASSNSKQNNVLLPVKKQFKLQQTCEKFLNNKKNNKHLSTCSKCSDPKCRPGLNFPQAGINIKIHNN